METKIFVPEQNANLEQNYQAVLWTNYGKYSVLHIVVESKLEFWVLGRQERVLMSGLWTLRSSQGSAERNQNSAIICNWIWYTNKLTIIYLQSKLKDMECATIIYKLKQRNMVIFAFLCSPLYKIRNIFPVVCFLLSLSCFCRNTHSWMEASLEASISSQL